MKGMGPRAKTNANSIIHLLGYSMSHGQNQKESMSKPFAFNKTVALGCLVNKYTQVYIHDANRSSEMLRKVPNIEQVSGRT